MRKKRHGSQGSGVKAGRSGAGPGLQMCVYEHRILVRVNINPGADLPFIYPRREQQGDGFRQGEADRKGSRNSDMQLVATASFSLGI
jgi:hypothetical protein